MKDAISQYSKGYTLIELLLVMAIVSILSTIGISSFNSYSQNETLTNATNELYSAINSAKSRAQTQVKPQVANCKNDQNKSLDGYQVSIYQAPNGKCSPNTTSCYEIAPVCGTEVNSEKVNKSFPSSVSVGSTVTFQFDVLTGQVSEASPTIPITLTSGSRSRTITIYNDGRITLN